MREKDEGEDEIQEAAQSETQVTQPTQTVFQSNKRLKADVWKEYIAIGVGQDGKNRGRCIHCGKDLIVEVRHGTSALKRHLQICPKKPVKDNEERVRKYNHKVDREMTSDIIIYHDLPFRYVEYEKVRARDKYLNLDCEHICRQTAVADVFKRYELEKVKLKRHFANLKSRVCFTSDLWTTRSTMMGYICVKAHYIDDSWNLNNKILAFCDIKPPHTGEEIAKKIFDCLKEWGLEKKVFTITMDNATSNTSMQRILKHRLQMISGNRLPCDGKFLHVRCCAHILNLIVKEGLELADSLLENIRNSVKFVKASDSRFKTQILKSAYDKLDPSTSQEKVDIVKENLKLLYEEYTTKPWASSSNRSTTPTPDELLTESPLEDDFNSDLFELEKSIQPGLDNTKSSLEFYLEEPRLELRAFTDIEVLSYWKNNGHRHGDLASLACDLRSIPITTVASESAFSIGGRVLTPYRNRLLPKNVQALLCTRNWLRGYAELEGDVEDYLDDKEEEVTNVASNSGARDSDI